MNNTEEIKELIRKEIQSIDSLQERVAFKHLMEQVFLSLYETNKQMYEDLEKRVQDEMAYDVNQYLIRTGVMEKAFFDVSHHLMTPMEESDLITPSFHLGDVVESIKENGSFRLMKVMVRCDYVQLREIWDGNMEFHGWLETSKPDQVWDVTVKLRQNTEYLKKIGHLYQLFIKNGIPWQTINAPYLYKMADVVLTKLPEGLSGNEEIKRIRVDFESYNPMICYEMIPIWNIQKLTLDSVGFPVPCEDHKNYEHAISIKEHGIQHAYLAEDDLDIQSISQRETKLLIVSGNSVAKKWNIYMIRNAQDSQIDHYTYPIMQNERKDSFVEKFQRKWNQTIKTRWELERFINGFGLERYLVYSGCQVMDQFQDKIETYSTNAFIEDEIRDTRKQKKLVLYFKGGTHETWLQWDIASFIVSEVQRIYPEYECGGMIL